MTPRILLAAPIFVILVARLHAQPNQPDGAKMVLVTYSVADLVIPREKQSAEKKPPEATTVRVETNTRHEELIDLIVKSVRPATWHSFGGVGTIQFYPLGMSIVVNQTKEVHEEIQQLLSGLRSLANSDLEFTIELKLLTITDRGLRDVESFFKVLPDEHEKRPLAVLEKAEVKTFLQKAQERSINLMQAPRLTTEHGVCGGFKVGDERKLLTGVDVVSENGVIVPRPRYELVGLNRLQCDFTPRMTYDRKQIRVSLSLEMASLESIRSVPVSVPATHKRDDGTEHITQVNFTLDHAKIDQRRLERTFNVANGQTAILYGGSCKSAPRMLSHVTYLFGHGRPVQDRSHLLVIITPRIAGSEGTQSPIIGQDRPIPRP